MKRAAGRLRMSFFMPTIANAGAFPGDAEGFAAPTHSGSPIGVPSTRR